MFRKWYKKFKYWYIDKYYIPGYCKECGSCGEEGCCSPLSCMQKCMVDKNPLKCQYGEMYVRDLRFSYLMYEEFMEQEDLLKKKEISSDEFIENVDEYWNNLWDKIYNDPSKKTTKSLV